jgi:hypothetical protein
LQRVRVVGGVTGWSAAPSERLVEALIQPRVQLTLGRPVQSLYKGGWRYPSVPKRRVCEPKPLHIGQNPSLSWPRAQDQLVVSCAPLLIAMPREVDGGTDLRPRQEKTAVFFLFKTDVRELEPPVFTKDVREGTEADQR